MLQRWLANEVRPFWLFISSGMAVPSILPEASRMNSTFGGTVVVAALEIGAFEMSVSAAIAYCGVATKLASVAPAMSRLASPCRAVRLMGRSVMAFSCKLAVASSFGLNTPWSARS